MSFVSLAVVRFITRAIVPLWGRQFKGALSGKVADQRRKAFSKLLDQKKKVGRSFYFSFAIARTDLIEMITAAGAAKATMYVKMWSANS